MAYFSWQKKADDKGEEKFELPDEIVKQLKEGSEAKAEVSKMNTKLEELTTMFSTDLAARQKREKDEADRIAALNRNKKDEELDTELEELLLTNPREAIRRATEGQTNAIKSVHADNVRREVFEDGDKFPYYTGDIKREVDALLASQPVDFRLHPANVESTYHTIIGKHNKELMEGKIKSRFAGSEGNRGTSNGSAGSSGTGGSDGKKPEITDDIRRAAKQVGIKVEDYAEMLEKEGII